LLVFGLAALISIWIVGLLIDRMLRPLVLISLMGFALASIALWVGGTSALIVYTVVVLWGLTFGGAATLLQAAQANASGEEGVDIAMPINTTVWNLAIAGGGIVGGALLEPCWSTIVSRSAVDSADCCFDYRVKCEEIRLPKVTIKTGIPINFIIFEHQAISLDHPKT
jgi:predicted MFS family arabinose efflux permease